MEGSIYSGNAQQDGSEYNGWFIGTLKNWAIQNKVANLPEEFALRDTSQVEVKWGVHPAGQLRPSGWASPSGKTCLSLLVRGYFILKFRPPGEPELESAYHLKIEGDYLLWREEIEHTWLAQVDSVILTVRWKEE